MRDARMTVKDGRPYYVIGDRLFPAAPFSGGEAIESMLRGASSRTANELAYFAALPEIVSAYRSYFQSTRPSAYPPAAPSLDATGEFLTISRFLNDPTAVSQRVRDIAAERFVSDRILTGRTAAGGGAIVVEQEAEDIFPSRGEVESRQPGAEYPLADIVEGVEGEVFLVKDWGLATIVTVESIRRRRRQPVDRALSILSNAVVRKVDSASNTALMAQPIQTLAGADWTTATTDIVSQIENAKRLIRALNRGFEADILLVDDTRYTELLLNDDIRPLFDILAGDPQVSRLLGLTVVATPNLPSAASAFVLDSRVVGGMADEEPLGADSIFQRERKRWVVIAERVTTPWISTPEAVVQITGV